MPARFALGAFGEIDMSRLALGMMAVVGFTACKVHHPLLPPRSGTVSNRMYQYPSGLRLVVEPEPGVKRVAVSMLVGAGSAQDPPEKAGLAHFLEHLAFRSSPLGRLSALDELDFGGVGGINAATGSEFTAYFGVAPAPYASQVLPLFASLLVKPLAGVTDDVIAVERNVVLSERFDTDPHAGGGVLDALVAAVLPDGFPGRRSRGGTAETLGGVTRDDLEAFRQAHYQPDNCVVVITGEMTMEQARVLLAAAFPREWLDSPVLVPPRNAQGAVAARVPNPPPVRPRPIVESRVSHRQLLISWAVPGLAQPAGPAMPLVRDRLEQALEKPEGVLSLDVSLSPDVRVSLLTVAATLKDDAKPDEVRDALVKTQDFGTFSKREWMYSMVSNIASDQNLAQRAYGRALSVFATGKPRPLDTGPTPERLASLKAFEEKALVWSRSREVLVVPFVRTTPKETGPAPALTGKRQGVAIDPQGLVAVALGPPVGQVKTFTLENGLNVVLSRRPALPVVSVALGLPARALHTSRAVSLLLGAMLRWDLQDDMWRAGRPTVTVGADATVAQLSGASVFLPLMLDTLGHNLPPRVDWYGVEFMNRFLERFEELVADLSPEETYELSKRRPSLLPALMPPRSTAVPVTLEELNGLERGPFVDFVDLAWRPDGAWLVIDGDLDFEPTEQIVRDNFSGWRRSGAPVPPANSPGELPRPPKKVTVVENQDAAVTHVRFLCRLPPAGAAGAGSAAVLQQALDAYFGDELRGQLGLTYGVAVHTSRWRHEDNLLVMTTTLNSDNKQAALRRFFELLHTLDAAALTRRELDVARWHAAKERLSSGLRSSTVAYELANAAASGVPLAEALEAPERFTRTTSEAVTAAWKHCHDTAVLEIEGERSSLERAVKDSGQEALVK